MDKQLYFAVLLLTIMVLVAQFAYMPASVSLIWLIMLLVIVWRYFYAALKPISKLFLVALVCTALGLIYLSFKTFLGVEAGVALLTTCLYAKCIESKSTRDLLVVFNFGLFVCASLFLHSQSALMLIGVLVGLMFCLIGLYRTQIHGFVETNSTRSSIKHDVILTIRTILIATPFFLILFIFFPRFPPLWHVPLTSHQGMTGMSDQMSPGDIAELSQSTALAFRIMGDLTQLPPQQQRYWRAMVLDQYDGAVWTSHAVNQLPIRNEILPHQVVRYQYLSALPNQSWIMGLDQSGVRDPNYQQYADGSIKQIRRPSGTVPIELYWMQTQTNTTARTIQLRQALDAPQQLAPRTFALAQQLWQQSNSNPSLYIERVLHWYQTQGFVYTLSPGVLSGNRMDQFLFERKEGFCEHYASSFVLLMRYAGIPARIVVGYQGGQLAPDAKSWEVRQLDAHAWTEVYLNDTWQRIDPTAVIAPARIDEGMQRYLEGNQNVWGNQAQSGWARHNFNFLKTLIIWRDYFDYQWQSKVVGYDVNRQQNFLASLGIFSSTKAMLMMLSLIAVVVIIFVWGYGYFYRPKCSRLERLINGFSHKIHKSLQKNKSETFKSWFQRLSMHVKHTKPFDDAIAVHEKIQFSGEFSDKDYIKFKELLKLCASELKSLEKACVRKGN